MIQDKNTFSTVIGDYMIQTNKNLNKERKSLLVIAGGTLNSESVATNQNKLLQLLTAIFDNVYYITFCDKKYIHILNKKNLLDPNNISFLKLFSNQAATFIYAQIMDSLHIISYYIKHKFDIVLFTMGQDLQVLPIIISKALGKKVIIRSSGRPTFIIEKNLKSKSIIKTKAFKIIEEVNYNLADVILTECEYAIRENDFEKYNKTHVANLFVDHKFKFETPLTSRQYDVGYIGSFSEVKGVMNFVESIPFILETKPNLKIFIAGNGVQKEEVENRIKYMNHPNIKLEGWISHERLPRCLNNLKLLVLPSIKEGLPNMIMEGMACGTIILGTPVGAIPALVIDEKTGFIMDNNSPACIAENVLRALDHLDLELMANRSRKFIETEFSYEESLVKFKAAINLLGSR